MTRTLTVLMQRKKENDHHKEGVNYTGWNILWPNGDPTNVAFAAFCKIGVRSIFGRKLMEDSCEINLFFTPCNELDKLIKGKRRLYILKQNNKATVFLPNDEPTPIMFTNHDDPRILNWIGWNTLKENIPSWFDFSTSKSEQPLLTKTNS